MMPVDGATQIHRCAQSGKRKGLDQRWTMGPKSSIGNVRALVSLFGANKLDATVLIDLQGKERLSAKSLDEADVGLLPQINNDIRIQVRADRKRRHTLACEGAVALYAFEAPRAA